MRKVSGSLCEPRQDIILKQTPVSFEEHLKIDRATSKRVLKKFPGDEALEDGVVAEAFGRKPGMIDEKRRRGAAFRIYGKPRPGDCA
jgi:hypothetical protein